MIQADKVHLSVVSITSDIRDLSSMDESVVTL